MKINNYYFNHNYRSQYFFKRKYETQHPIEWENMGFKSIESTGFNIWKQLCMEG